MLGVCPFASKVYADVSAAMLVVSVATFVVRVALFSISCVSVVRSVVAAAARLSRYPSKRANVSGVIAASSTSMTEFAVPVFLPAANCCHLRVM